METFAIRPAHHTRLRIITSHPTEFVDLTDRVHTLITEAQIQSGIINVQSLHTTAAIVLNEHEPLLLADFAALLERAAPLGAPYQHDDPSARTVNLIPGERVNGHAHCRALLLSPSACLNIVDGRLELGRWQRIFLAELDGPRVRDLSVITWGSAPAPRSASSQARFGHVCTQGDDGR
jgi:secondary thiamine-phosphate synthase enzyme